MLAAGGFFMATSVNVTGHRRNAAALAGRLVSASIPKSLAATAKIFTAAQKAFEAAANAVDTAEEAHDGSLGDIKTADGALDASVDTLVDLLPGAGLGTRQQPLKGFSTKRPSELKAMAYADEPDEVDRTVKKILAKKPNADVVKACKAATAAGAVVRTKLAAYPGKVAAYTKAITTRNGLLPGLLKATDTLKRHAAVAWENDPATFKSVFAAPSRVEAPTKKRAKKAVGAPAAAPAAKTTPG
jgi:hypothetical protein